MEESTETTAQQAVKIPDKVWKVAFAGIAYGVFLGTQQYTQAERQDDFEKNLADILQVQYTYAIDINTLKVTMASYESLGEMSNRLESLIDTLEDGTGAETGN